MKKSSIPPIQDNERVIRIIFFPKYYDNKRCELKIGAFGSKADKDEVSVFRLLLATLNYCKKKSKIIQANSKKLHKKKEIFGKPLEYVGMALVSVNVIKNVGAKIIPTSKDGHANIVYNFIVKRGEPRPPKLIEMMQTILHNCKFFKDPTPDSSNWEGEDLTAISLI